MGGLPIYEKSSHCWEVFPYTGSRPRYGKIASVVVVDVVVARDRESSRQKLSCEAALPPQACPRAVHSTVSVCIYIYTGSLGIYGKSSHAWQVCPYRGSIHIYLNINITKQKFIPVIVNPFCFVVLQSVGFHYNR